MQDWREGKSILECHLYMFENSVGCDVTFVAGETKERIAAHKYVLSCMSPVFQAMFMGSLASDDPEVSVPDCDPAVFKEFLRYLYSDTIDINEKTACHLLYFAKKYLVLQLIQKTSAYLDNSLNGLNCLLIFQQANRLDERNLERKALDMICANAEVILKSEELIYLSENALGKVIDADTLGAREETVFEAAMRWANKKCTEHGLDVTPVNQRTVLGDIIHLIRFPLMDHAYFEENVLGLKLLTIEEGYAITRHMLRPTTNVEMNFKRTPRVPKTLKCRRFDLNAGSLSSWNQSGQPDAINFKVNKDVCVVGFELFGPEKDDSAHYEVTYAVFDVDSDKNLYEGHEKKVIFSREIAQFLFRGPVRVCRDKVYALSVTVKGPDCGVLKTVGITDVTVDDILFHFSNSAKSTNGTSTVTGQIPGILFYRR